MSKKIVIRLGNPKNPHFKHKRYKAAKRNVICSHGLIGVYGEKVRPINKGSAIATGLLNEDGRRNFGLIDEDLTVDATQATRLSALIGISYELVCKCLKGQLDNFDIAEVKNAISFTRQKSDLSDEDSRELELFVKRVSKLVPGISPIRRATIQVVKTLPPRKLSIQWKVSKICPSCGKKRLNRDFRYCPMCGRKLPQKDD